MSFRDFVAVAVDAVAVADDDDYSCVRELRTVKWNKKEERENKKQRWERKKRRGDGNLNFLFDRVRPMYMCDERVRVCGMASTWKYVLCIYIILVCILNKIACDITYTIPMLGYVRNGDERGREKIRMIRVFQQCRFQANNHSISM